MSLLVHGDCLDVMAGMEPESVDAVVTDPPYGLEFMGKAWDKLATILPESAGYNNPGSRAKKSPMDTWGKRPSGYVAGAPMQEWHQQWAEAAYRVAKPSAYLLAFGGTRTVHRLTSAIEDAGWIIRDMLVWAYASGFPKSKASLKPAWEPIVMARKPGPLRMLAIDECRIGTTKDVPTSASRTPNAIYGGGIGSLGTGETGGGFDPNLGRWPANVILTDPIFDGGWEGVVGGGETTSGSRNGQYAGSASWSGEYGPVSRDVAGDSGTYSRFFLIPKADRADREPVLGGLPERFRATLSGGDDRRGLVPGSEANRNGSTRANVHPTVKPVDLMRHLVRLVTPTGGTVLDPFAGSGTTAIAAEQEGFPWILIEKEAEYVAIAEARLNGTQRGLGLPA